MQKTHSFEPQVFAEASLLLLLHLQFRFPSQQYFLRPGCPPCARDVGPVSVVWYSDLDRWNFDSFPVTFRLHEEMR